MKEICLVIPTIRKNSFDDFIKRWDAVGLFDHVDLMVMEDNPFPTFTIDAKIPGIVTHLSWNDIRSTLTEDGWIIPRRSDTVRSFAYYRAWKMGYKYILTLDDDCYPPTEQDGLSYNGAGFVGEHLRQLNARSRWFNTLNSVKPRGIPFYNLGKSGNVVVNHGLWTNVLDYDAPYQLANPIKEQFSFDSRVVPSGLYFPMCGMNVMWRADVTVLMYHLLMGHGYGRMFPTPEETGLVKLPFDRFGDIWCGVFMKKIVDHLGNIVTTGMPYVRHERASNPFTNLKKEANGIEVNEELWEYVDGIDLGSYSSEVSCYTALGRQMEGFPLTFPKYKEYEHYFRVLSIAMQKWAELFQEAK